MISLFVTFGTDPAYVFGTILSFESKVSVKAMAYIVAVECVSKFASFKQWFT